MGQVTSKNSQGKTAWVLTREHNDYDQHGEYFVAVFSRKPSHGELATAISGHDCGNGGDPPVSAPALGPRSIVSVSMAVASN